MEEDRENGWWAAPTAAKCKGQWVCPDCKEPSPIGEWLEHQVPCELCGEHDGRMCPECEEVFDHIEGSNRIGGATIPSPIRITRPPNPGLDILFGQE